MSYLIKKKSELMSTISHYIFRLFWELSRRVSYFQNLFRLLPFFTSYSTKNSAEFFGEAIEHYHSNEMRSRFRIYQHCLHKGFNGKIQEFDLGIYFRKWDNLHSIEKLLITTSYGKILDIGSNTGYYIPFLMEKGPTTGIEISPKLINLARKEGIYNCILGDFFTYKFKNKFDTITLIGNDVALSGTLWRLKKLLKKLSKLLNKNGQVLLLIRHIHTLKYWHVVYTPHYNGRFGIPAKYLFLNSQFFIKLSTKYGFQASILGKDIQIQNSFHFIRLIKTSR